MVDARGTLICRGSWVLGSCCGACARCSKEALELIPRLLQETKDQKLLIARVKSVIPRGYDPPIDHTDQHKLHCYDEARRILYEKKA